MEGVFINKLNVEVNTSEIASAGIRLLAKCGDMEIMEQTFVAEDTVWFSPAKDPETMEYFFIHSGSVELVLDTETRLLKAGDSVTLKGLKRDIIVKSISDTRMIYVSNRPIFNEARDFETYLKTLIKQIDEKDHYTFQHSMNVMCYTVAIYEAMDKSLKESQTQLKDILVAALFHDVGKCFTPDDILKKKGRLEPEEMKIIRHHPVDSGRLLRKYYNSRIAEIAENHHERINGSGYPFGKTAKDLGTEERMLACLDIYQALIEDRPYRKGMTHAQAIAILSALVSQEQLDADLVHAIDLCFMQSSVAAV